LEGPKRLKVQLNAGFGKFAEQYDVVKPSTDPNIRVNTFVETSFWYSDLRLKYRFPLSYRFHPFLTAGAGVLSFTPRDESGRSLEGATFSREADEVYSTIIPQIPVGAGVQARLNQSVSFSLEYLFRYTPTDYLDNIGRLGTRDGNDFLHGFQLSMYFTLSPPEENLPADPYGGFSETETLADTATGEVSVDTLPSDPVVNQLPEEPTQEQSNLNEIGRQELEAQAIAERRFVYHRVKKGDTLEKLADRYKVSMENLRTINFLSSDQLIKGQRLRIPDTGAVQP
jgi:LysM repeat protein